MDGIEATEFIRSFEASMDVKDENRLPVVALTANAVSGVREMFIEKGFDDFLAKPVDVSALDDILNKWISKNKRERGADNQQEKLYQFPNISGIDIIKGIKMTGGTEEGYASVLSTFCRDAIERLQVLRNTLYDETLSMFITNVHALKSASAAIGAMELPEQAFALENAGREKNRDFINENLDKFMKHLANLVKGIQDALETGKDKQESRDTNKTELFALLKSLKSAIISQKAESIDRILEEINQLSLDKTTSRELEKISDDILMAEFDNVLKTIDNIFNDKH
jgi:CheY-like chemotaxis protein